MKTKENGVTLIALVITIILLLILASIGVTIGTSTIDSAAFTQFKSELKIMQSTVNELNQSNKINIGLLPDLTDNQKNILNIPAISDIIFFNGATEEEKTKIQNGFKYFNTDIISTELNLDSVKRSYLINVEYRYVIFPDGFEYKGTKYYMIDQIDGEIYNVRYNDKNEKTGSFEVNVTSENNKCKVEITNINYNGYVDKWQVKYQLEGNSYWETSDDLTFYIRKEGTYTIKVTHSDEIVLESKKVRILYDGSISDKIENGIVKIGDYVQYTPDEVSTTDEAYTNLISELGTYSGSNSNTTSTLTQERLNWRVLDVVDGKVRLISEVPTTSGIRLSTYNGYNNAVYLIDNTCKTLYNSSYASNVQNLKIEDIEKYLTYDYTQVENTNVNTGKYGGSKEYVNESNRFYPNIFTKEKTGWLDGVQGTELNLSEQKKDDLTTGSAQSSTSIKATETRWKKQMVSSDFTNPIYYTLFINNGKNNYSTYWMSSRCVLNSDYNTAYFSVRLITSGIVASYDLYKSDDSTNSNFCAIRPVITLNSNVQIDATEIERDGTTEENAYIIK